jgi:hypothetical protein
MLTALLAVSLTWVVTFGVGSVFPRLQALAFSVAGCVFFTLGYIRVGGLTLKSPPGRIRLAASLFPPWLRTAGGVLLAAASSYSLGYVLYIATQSAVGRLPFWNVVLPIGTWSMAALGCFAVAWEVSDSRRVLLWPFVINAALAATAASAHPVDLVPASGLVLAGALVHRIGRRLSP